MNLKVDLSHFFDNVYKNALVYIDLEEFKTAKDVIDYICSLYQINNGEECLLSVDGWVIHPEQPSNIFRGISQPTVLYTKKYGTPPLKSHCSIHKESSKKKRTKKPSQDVDESSVSFNDLTPKRTTMSGENECLQNAAQSIRCSLICSTPHDSPELTVKEKPLVLNSPQVLENNRESFELKLSKKKKRKKEKKSSSTPENDLSIMESYKSADILNSLGETSSLNFETGTEISYSIDEESSRNRRKKKSYQENDECSILFKDQNAKKAFMNIENGCSQNILTLQSIQNSAICSMTSRESSELPRKETSLVLDSPLDLESNKSSLALDLPQRKKRKKEKKRLSTHEKDFSSEKSFKCALLCNPRSQIENGINSIKGDSGGLPDLPTPPSFQAEDASMQESTINENDILAESSSNLSFKRKRKRKHNKSKKVKKPFDFTESCGANIEAPVPYNETPPPSSFVKSKKHVLFKNGEDESLHLDSSNFSNEKKRKKRTSEPSLKDNDTYRCISSTDPTFTPITKSKSVPEFYSEKKDLESDFAILNELQNSKHPIHFKRKRPNVEAAVKPIIPPVAHEDCKRDPPAGVILNDVLSPEDEQTFHELIWLSQSKFNQVFYRNNTPSCTNSMPCERAQPKRQSKRDDAKYPSLLESVDFSLLDLSTNDHLGNGTCNNSAANECDQPGDNDKHEEECSLPTFVGYSAKPKKAKSYSSMASFLKNLRHNANLPPEGVQEDLDDSHNPIQEENLAKIKKDEDEVSAKEIASIKETDHDTIDLSKDEDLCNLEIQQEKYESYPILGALPKPGDVIVIKTMSLDENFCPKYSEFFPAKVQSVDGVKISLQHCTKEEKAGGKSHVVHQEENKNKTFELDWRDIYEARLLYP